MTADRWNPDIGLPPLDEIDVGQGDEKDTSGGRQPTAGESTPAPAELPVHAAGSGRR